MQQIKKSLICRKVVISTENDVLTVAFAGSTDDTPEDYLILSRTFFPEDEQDFGLHMECNFAESSYNLITKIAVEKQRIIIFTRCDNVHTIEIQLNDIEEQAVQEAINKLLR